MIFLKTRMPVYTMFDSRKREFSFDSDVQEIWFFKKQQPVHEKFHAQISA